MNISLTENSKEPQSVDYDSRANYDSRAKFHIRLLAALRVLGLSRQVVPGVTVGKKAYVQWWQRLLALVTLVILLAIISIALTAAIGLILLAGGLLLEGAIT